MARIVNAKLQAGRLKRLSAEQRREAARKIRARQAENRLRRVRLACHGWVRDAVANEGDWVWCEGCADLRRVDEVAE